jgi:hypothetical protein
MGAASKSWAKLIAIVHKTHDPQAEAHPCTNFLPGFGQARFREKVKA